MPIGRSFNDLAKDPSVACVSARLVASTWLEDWDRPLLGWKHLESAICAATLKGSDLKLRIGKQRTLFLCLDHTG